MVAAGMVAAITEDLDVPLAAYRDLRQALAEGRYTLVQVSAGAATGYLVWERRLGAFQFVLVNFPARKGAPWTAAVIEQYTVPKARELGCWAVAADVERPGMGRRLGAMGFAAGERRILELQVA